ncbi:lytic murein transglycosylase, partial [Methylobacterium sp. J-078]|nr:lytic murein transglycosylase [Methylobacterium sp. J-078]
MDGDGDGRRDLVDSVPDAVAPPPGWLHPDRAGWGPAHRPGPSRPDVGPLGFGAAGHRYPARPRAMMAPATGTAPPVARAVALAAANQTRASYRAGR